MFTSSQYDEGVLGADPEFAAVDERGWCVPATRVLRTIDKKWGVREPVKGDSYKGPYFVFGPPGFSFQSDGASLEVNIPPDNSTQALVDSLRATFQVGHAIVSELGLRLEMLSTIPISLDQIKAGGIELSEFGCDVDHNPYGDTVNQADVDPTTLQARFFGGHIHMSPHTGMGERFYTENVYETVVALDLLVGLADVMLDGTEGAAARRKVYGRAGRYRPQKWGFEYRSPGSVYLRSPHTTAMMFELTKRATWLATNDALVYELLDVVTFTGMLDTINKADTDAATQLWTKMLPILNRTFADSEELFNEVLHIGQTGGIMQSPSLSDLYQNWSLE